MISKTQILINIINRKYADYSKKNHTHKFLYDIDKNITSDSHYKVASHLAYLMNHIDSLDKADPVYPDYLKHLYALYLEFQHRVRVGFEEEDKIYKNLIASNIMNKTFETSMLLDMAFYNEEKMVELYAHIKSDKKELLSIVVLNTLDEYQAFKKQANDTTFYFRTYAKNFQERFDELM